MELVSLHMFSRAPSRASLERLQRYMKAHDRMMRNTQKLDELREKIIANLNRANNRDFYREPSRIDMKL